VNSLSEIVPFPALELGVGEDRGVKSAAQRGIWRTWVTDAQKVIGRVEHPLRDCLQHGAVGA
jgi:hypothetical protein